MRHRIHIIVFVGLSTYASLIVGMIIDNLVSDGFAPQVIRQLLPKDSVPSRAVFPRFV